MLNRSASDPLAVSPVNAESAEPLGIRLHQNGVVFDVDDQAALIFGCTRHELIGRRVADLIIRRGMRRERCGGCAELERATRRYRNPAAPFAAKGAQI